MDELRISDADREEAVALLGEQYAVGRLDKDEFDERSDAVWSARTRGDLAPVFADLPTGTTRAPARVVPRAVARPRPGFPARLFVPVLFAVIALTVLTHLPFVLLGLVLWFVLARHGVLRHPGWAGRHDGRGCGRA